MIAFGCQNYNPFWATLNTRRRIRIGIQKGTQNFDKHPSEPCQSRMQQQLRQQQHQQQQQMLQPFQGMVPAQNAVRHGDPGPTDEEVWGLGFRTGGKGFGFLVLARVWRSGFSASRLLGVVASVSFPVAGFCLPPFSLNPKP